ncbi:response regulator [Sulfurimonas sp. MAG313]|nr:response regulator [Sulfurimonas sp. MAG313]MDF1880687.1 response regulator [Sulfurimonas sp. MAG313]
MNKVKVLAVDDDIINLKLLKSILLKLDTVEDVIEAKNGADALGILKNQDDIGLILLDIIMPVMGGIEMLKVVRADQSLKNIPVIVLTTDETKRTEALDCGANDFIMKPVRKDMVGEKVNRLLNI